MTQPYSAVTTLVTALPFRFTKFIQLFHKLALALILILCYSQVSAQFTITENFKGSSAGNNIVLGGSGANIARLTSGREDPVNDGWLRLNAATGSQRGFAYINTPFPSTLGVIIDFEYKTWRNVDDLTYNGADGLSVFMFNAAVPFAIGGYGGSLGYAPNSDGGSPKGLAGGYVGLGFDEYGNYGRAAEGRNGGTSVLKPNSIVLRGATTDIVSTTNPFLTGVTLSNGNVLAISTNTGVSNQNEIDYNTKTATRPTDLQFYRRVQIEIVPSGGNYKITVRWTKTVNGAFTQLFTYDITTPPPPNLKLGFASSTGGGVNFHEIRNVMITTPGGVRVDKAVDKSSAIAGQDVTYSVNVTNSTPAALSSLTLADTIRNSNNAILTSSDFTINSITFNNNGNLGNTTPGFTSGVAKTGGTNPFNAVLNMAANSTSTFIIKGTINPLYSNSVLKNSVGVDPSLTGITDTDLTNNYFTVSTNVLKQAVDLAITGTVDNTCFVPGGNTYTYTVTNQGSTPTVGLTTVTYNLPNNFSMVGTPSGTGWTVTKVGSNYTFNRTLGLLDPLASGFAYPPIIIKVLGPNTGGPWVNTANVSYPLDSDGTNNTVSITTYANPVVPTVPASIVNYCLGQTAMPLTATGTNLKWYTVPVGGVGNITAPTPSTTTAGTTIYYVTQSNGSCEGPMTAISVVVQPVVTNNTITPPTVLTLCGSGNPGLIIGSTANGGNGAVTYQWQSSIDNTNYNNIAGTDANYTPGSITVTTWFRRVAQSGACTLPNNSNVIKFTVNPILTAGTIGANQTFCQSGIPATFNELTPATGADQIYTYQWQSSISSATAGFTDIPGATQKAYSPAVAINQTTYYRRTVTALNSSCGAVNSTAVTVTVTPQITGNTLNIPALTAFCGSGDPVAITGAIPSGGSGTNSYGWEQSADGGANWTIIVGANADSYDPPLINSTTMYRRTVSSGACSVTSGTVTITVYPTPTTSNAGTDQQQCAQDVFQLAGNVPAVGKGVWVVDSGQATIDNINLPNAKVTLAKGNTAILSWIISNGTCPPSVSQVTLTNFNTPTIANAGLDITQYNSGSFTMNANIPSSGKGLWTVKTGSAATIANPTATNTLVTIAPGTTATLIWTVSNGVCTASSDEVVITYTRSADIKVIKSVVTPGPFVAGQAIVYRIITTNNGPSDATGIKIIDNVPANIVVSSITPNAMGTAAVIQNSSSGNVINVTADLAFGTANSITVDVNGTVAANYSGSLSNTVTVTSPIMPDPDGATSTVTNQVDRKPVLSIFKDGPANVIAGDAIAYKITIKNTSTSDAIATAIKDIIPAQIGSVNWTLNKTGTASFTGNATNSGNSINFTGNIPAGTENTIVIDVTGVVLPSATGSFSNTATVTPSESVPPVVSNTVVTTISSKTGLVMLKNGPATAQAGSPIVYTLKITNNGLSDAVNASITDIIPPEIKTVSWIATKQGSATINGTGNGTGNNISLNGNVPAGAANAILVTISGTVDPSFSGNISNIATAKPSEVGGASSSSTAITQVGRMPIVGITKTGPATLTAGQQINYSIEVSNNSVADAKALVITDMIPAELKNVSWNTTTQGGANIIGTGNGTDNNLSITGNLPAGAANKIIISITGTVSASFSGTLTNTATATPAEPGTTAKTASSSAQITRLPVLSILKSGPATITSGEQITYTVTVANTGVSDAVGLQISDLVPASIIKNVSWTSTPEGAAAIHAGDTGAGNTITATADIPAGAANKITLTVRGTVDPSFNGDILNTATATPSESTAVAVSSSVTTTSSRKPELSVSKTGPTTLVSGQNITYTITINNFSSSDAKALVMTDQVPAIVTGVTWSAIAAGTALINGTASGAGNNISLNADLATGSGNSITLTVNGKIAPSFDGQLTNTATVTPAEVGTVVKSASSTTNISRIPILSIQKTGPTSISAGQQINYTLTISNTGTADALQATITDAIPTGISNVSWTATPAGAATITGTTSGSTNALSFVGNIPAGADHIIRVTIQGDVSSAATGTLVNTATVTPSEPTAAPASSTVTTTLHSVPGITLSKSGPTQISAGQTITYTLIAANSGPSDATSLSITDAVPLPLTNVKWTATAEGTATITAGAGGSGSNVSVKGDIAAGTGNRIVITITGQVPSSNAITSIVNMAKASPSELDVPPVNSNIITTIVNKKVNISAIKSATAFLSAGENVTYILEVKNTGPSDAQNLLIADQIPLGVKNVVWTTNPSGAASIISGATGTGNSMSLRANLPAGNDNVILVTITGKVDPNFPGTELVNLFTVSPDEPGNPMSSSNTTRTKINKTADIQIEKTGPATAIAGRTINYTITVNNAGPSDANNVNIVDAIPVDLTDVKWTATAQNGAFIIGATNGLGNDIDIHSGIPAGAGKVIINISGTIDPAYASGTLTNTATATPEAGVTDPTPATSTVITAISRVANVRIIKSGPANIVAGQPIKYNLRVVNDGASFAPGVIIRDLLTGGIPISNVVWTAQALGGATVSATNGTDDVNLTADIPSNIGSVEINIEGIVSPGATGNFSNTATANFPPDSPVTDPDLGSNTSAITTAVRVETNLSVSKSGPASIGIGDRIDYTIEVRNNGISNITGILITDIVPDVVTVSSWSAKAIDGSSIEGNLNGTVFGSLNAIHTFGDIPATIPGSPPSLILITIQGIVNNTAETTFTNKVSVEANGIKESAVVTAVNRSTDIFIEKNGPQDALAGSAISYQIKVGNDGPVNATALSIEDIVPVEIKNVTWNATAFGNASISAGAFGGTNAIQTTAAIEAGAANYIMINVQGTIDAAITPKTISNTAKVILPAGITDFNTENNTSSTKTVVESKSGLSIRKLGPADAISGSEITYTIIVSNAGPSNAVQTKITDAVPANIKNVSWTTAKAGTANVTTSATGTAAGDNLVTLIADLPAGAGNEVTITIKGTIDPGFTGTLVNNAVATPSELNNPAVTSENISTTVTNKSALSIVKTGPSRIDAGTTLQYQLMVSNTGPSNSVGAIITDQIPAGLTNVRWTTATTAGAAVTTGASGNINPVSITANFLAGIGTLTVTILADVPANSQLSAVQNTATVRPAVVDLNNPVVTSNEVITDIVKNVNLQLTKSGPSTLNAGEGITYTLAIRNAGPSNAIASRLTDAVPSAIKNVSWSTISSGVTITSGASGTGNNVDLTADIPANGVILINVRGTVDPLFAGLLTNIAWLSPTEPGKAPVEAEAITTVKKLTRLQISKSGASAAVAGQVMTYQIKVSNNGPSTALNALITDAIPVQLEQVRWTATASGTSAITEGANGSGNDLRVKADIPVGAQNEITIQITGKISAGYGGTLNNIATATPADPDNVPVVTPPVITEITRLPQIILSKTGPATATAGGQVIYTIEANNTGLSDASNLIIEDLVPPELKNVNWAATISGNSSINSSIQGSGNAININVNIPAGASNKVTIIVKGTVDPAFAGTINNRATAKPAELLNTIVNSPQVQTEVKQVPVIVVNKTGPATATAGGPISYVIELSNTGLSNAKNLAISDLIDPAITGVSWVATTGGLSSINGAANGSGNVQLNANIPAGTGNKISITITGTILPAATGKLTNTATAKPSEPGIPAVLSNPVETNIAQKPVVQITKTGPPVATAGGQVTYTIEVINTGLSNAVGIGIVDNISSQLDNVSWTSLAGGTATILSGGTGAGRAMLLSANIPAGLASNKITITIKGTVHPDFSGKLHNVATVKIPLPDIPDVNTPPVETEVDAKPGIIISKNGPSTAIAGSEITYTIVAGNTGLSNARSLAITDNVPATLTGVTWTSAVAGSAVINAGGAGSGNMLLLNADIPAGAANFVTITVKGTIDPAFNANLTNTAVAIPSEPGIAPVNASKTTVVSKTPVLSIVKNGPGIIAAGKDIVYTLSIQNTGTANADNASITDAVPIEISNVSWEAVAQGTASILSGAKGNTNNLSLNVSVPAGAGNSILVTVKGTVSASATADLINKASITPSEQGTIPASSIVTTKLKSESSVSLVKNGPTSISAGQTLTYTLIAGNNGPSDAQNLTITDAVPAILTDVKWAVTTTGAASVTQGASGIGNNVLIKGGIPAGMANQILVTITGKVPSSTAAGTLTNTAVATPSEAGNPPVNSNIITTTVDQKLNIRAVKSAVATVTAGESITYELHVYNDGPADALNLSVKDNVPAGINNVSWTTAVKGAASITANGTGAVAAVSVNVNIPAGAGNSVTIFVKGNVDPAFTGASLKNSFIVTPTEPGNPPVISDEVITNVLRTADIQIQKIGPSAVVAGSNMSYTIDVKNAGPSYAAAVNILDNLPAGFTVLNWTATAKNGALISGPSTGNSNVSVTAAIPAATASVQIIVNGKVNADYAGTSLVNTATATPEAGVADPTPASSTVTTSIGKTANVRISKSGPADIAVGDLITYNLRIVNDGPSDAIGLLIKDVIPPNLEVGATWTSSVQGGASLNQTNGIGDIDLIGNVPSGTGLIEIKIVGKVKADNADKAVFTNTATAFFPSGSLIVDPELSSNTSTISTTVNNDPVLKVSKSGPATVNIGDPIEYTIIIRNGGAGNIVNAMVTDPVPDDVAVSSWTATISGGAILRGAASGSTNSIITSADIPADGDPNTTVMIKVNGTVKTTANAIFTNTVAVTANGERKSSVVTAVNQSTDIKIEKAGPQAVISGSPITYTIKVTNQGPRAVSGLTIRDNIPAQIAPISWTAQAIGAATVTGATNGTTNALLTKADIAVGAANFILITVNGTVNADAPSGSMSNIASVVLPVDITDYNLANNTSEVKTTISSVSGLVISKSGPQNAVSGTAITYTVKIRNDGLSNASQALIKDVVPAGINNVSWLASVNGLATIVTGASGTGNTVQVTANIPGGSGNEVNLTINGTIDAGYNGGPLLNTATVTPSEPGNPTVISPTVTTNVVNKSGLRLVKTGPSSMEAGTTLNYTLELTNIGPGNAFNADLLDQLPALLTNVSWTAIASNGAIIRSGAIGTGNKVNLKVDLPAGTATIRVNVKATLPANATGNINNTAVATPVEPGNPPVPSNVIVTKIVNNTNLSLQKSGPSNARSGETIVYTLTVENNGPSDAVGVKIGDAVPAQINTLSWTSMTSAGVAISSGNTGTGNNVQLTADIPAKGSIVVRITGKIDPSYTGSFTNTATLTPVDPAKPVISSAVVTSVKNLSNLRISKTGIATVTAGQAITYQIVVRNGGPGTAQSALITDQVPTGIVKVSWTAVASGAASISVGQAGSGNGLSVTATIPPGGNDFVTIDVKGTIDPSFAGKLSNIATVIPQGPDDNKQPIVTPPVETQVIGLPKITMMKTAPSAIKSGDMLTYTIEISNDSQGDAKDLMISDLISNNLTAVKWITTTSGKAKVLAGAIGSSNNLNIMADLPAGASNKIFITITGLVAKSFTGTITNTAKGITSEGTPDITSNTVETVVDVADFIIPNIITPNNDGNNDTFKIKGVENYPGTQVSIFNRWGNEVYRSDNYKNDWDGSQLNEGTYYYIVSRKEKTGNATVFKGWLFIKR